MLANAHAHTHIVAKEQNVRTLLHVRSLCPRLLMCALMHLNRQTQHAWTYADAFTDGCMHTRTTAHACTREGASQVRACGVERVVAVPQTRARTGGPSRHTSIACTCTLAVTCPHALTVARPSAVPSDTLVVQCGLMIEMRCGAVWSLRPWQAWPMAGVAPGRRGSRSALTGRCRRSTLTPTPQRRPRCMALRILPRCAVATGEPAGGRIGPVQAARDAWITAWRE